MRIENFWTTDKMADFQLYAYTKQKHTSFTLNIE